MNQFGIFAKFWQPGGVKTRLAAEIGEVAASRLYRAFLSCLLQRFAGSGQRRYLVYTPVERRAAFARLVSLTPGSSWLLSPQGMGDLGQRMRHYFQRALARGARRVVLVGSDSPNLPPELVRQAFALLRTHSTVLGPSDDGGYYLIGVRDRVPPVFHDIAWSSDRVCRQTIARLQAHDWSYASLSPWYDVDTLPDLHRLRDDLRNRSVDRSTRRLADAVARALDARRR
jgi:rSAM/selenodomain-associated transferase 1